jgi:glycine oxidase
MKIVIVGAGVAGLSIGWRLVQAGADVTILDRHEPARAATWAAAGMIGVTSELAEAGAEEIKFANHSNDLWPGFATELEAWTGRAIGYRQSGALMVAATADALAQLGLRVESDSTLRLLDASETRALSPMLTSEFAGALWASSEAHVDSRALGSALAQAFRRAGGTLLTGQSVTAVRTSRGHATAALTHDAIHQADAILIAAGAWSGTLAEGLPPVTPIKGEIIALTPPPGAALPAQVVWGNGVYLVSRGGQLLVGATVENVGFDTALTEAAAAHLFSHAVALMPPLADWTRADHWAGLRPRSADGLPLLGPTAIKGLYLAGGQYRNGILFTPAIAEAVCAMMLDRADPIPAFDPRRREANP